MEFDTELWTLPKIKSKLQEKGIDASFNLIMLLATKATQSVIS